MVVLDGLDDGEAGPLLDLFANLAKQGKARLMVSVGEATGVALEGSMTTHKVSWEK